MEVATATRCVAAPVRVYSYLADAFRQVCGVCALARPLSPSDHCGALSVPCSSCLCGWCARGDTPADAWELHATMCLARFRWVGAQEQCGNAANVRRRLEDASRHERDGAPLRYRVASCAPSLHGAPLAPAVASLTRRLTAHSHEPPFLPAFSPGLLDCSSDSCSTSFFSADDSR